MALRWLVLILLVIEAQPAFAACEAGPDAESARALQTAFETQNAVAEHLRVAAIDRESRELRDTARDEPRPSGAIDAHASLNFATASVRGFRVCDTSDWEEARLGNQVVGASAGIGVRGFAALEFRTLGVSDSVIQRDLKPYYPEQRAGAHEVVPGAIGVGHSLWSARLEVLEHVSLTAGFVRSHSVEHRVGWAEEEDEDGNVEIARQHTRRWGDPGPSRGFVSVGSPRFGATEFVIGEGAIERVHGSTGWIVPRPRDPVAAIRVDGGYDSRIESGLAGIDLMPLRGRFGNPRGPRFVLRGATELSGPLLNEASVATKWRVPFTALGIESPGDAASLEVVSGLTGGSRLQQSGSQFVPGMVVRGDIAAPFIAILRLGAWGGVNRHETIQAVPDAIGRVEWGLSLSGSYSL